MKNVIKRRARVATESGVGVTGQVPATARMRAVAVVKKRQR